MTHPASRRRLPSASAVAPAALLLVGALAGNAPAWAQQATATAPATATATAAAGTKPAACPALLNHTMPRLQDEKPQNLCQYSGQVLLVVNTASFCGFTKQYKGLEDLYSRYKDKGLVVLGFPSNDFSQETGSNKDIAAFCENTYSVKFPMFAKSSVKGDEASPFYKQLIAKSGQTPRWNFYKYLIGRDGQVVESWSSMTSPDDKKLVAMVEKQLALAGK